MHNELTLKYIKTYAKDSKLLGDHINLIKHFRIL